MLIFAPFGCTLFCFEKIYHQLNTQFQSLRRFIFFSSILYFFSLQFAVVVYVWVWIYETNRDLNWMSGQINNDAWCLFQLAVKWIEKLHVYMAVVEIAFGFYCYWCWRWRCLLLIQTENSQYFWSMLRCSNDTRSARWQIFLTIITHSKNSWWHEELPCIFLEINMYLCRGR